MVVVAGKIVGRGFNKSIRQSDPTAHAEILALRQAAAAFGKLPVDFSHALLHAGTLFHVRWSLLIWTRLARTGLRRQGPQSGRYRFPFEARPEPDSQIIISKWFRESWKRKAAALLRQFFRRVASVA